MGRKNIHLVARSRQLQLRAAQQRRRRALRVDVHDEAARVLLQPHERVAQRARRGHELPNPHANLARGVFGRHRGERGHGAVELRAG